MHLASSDCKQYILVISRKSMYTVVLSYILEVNNIA